MSSSNDNSLYEGCKAYQSSVSTSYGYIPSEAAGIAFCVLFGLSMMVHVIQFCWKRTWWCSLFSIGCMVEVLGWAARLWAAICPYNSTAFMIQISTLIIAPTFYTAGIYVLLGRFIQLFGPASSMLTPKRYLWIFCTCDVVSLVIQAAGGGLASSESDEVNGDTSLGTNIMVAGIVFQLASISIFVICAVDFFRRSVRLGYRQALVNGPLSYLVGAMVFSVVCIYIRSIYRTIELAQGWSGYLITHQTYFIVLDGVMMVLAVAVFNIFHPGWLLPTDMAFALPKGQVTVEMDDAEAQRLHSSTEYAGYGHR
ncbi:RTA1 domain-containing protein [Aspergillus ibericus CBS 121593]|uniref:RTA1-domain-containing protein n=1 Tax=Aspergillus ibericus CBS 121593 TaxID=1448316 RepID=A0A395GND1_9EURO|nr:RTA1-domain-containing protein [Aspergillus ibericus CBS 121593]RAK96468.1 RTA1-domain-containing protein [Aspergillus ibericus CBS 121593]